MLKINQITDSKRSYTIENHNGSIIKYQACYRATFSEGMIRLTNVYAGTTYLARVDDVEINGEVPTSVDDALAKLEFILPFNSGGGASGTINSRLHVFVEKIGINNLIYPKHFSYNEDLTVSDVIPAGNAAGASFTVDGVDYDENTLVGVTIPTGIDLIINDIEIKAGYDTGSMTIIF